MIEPRLEQDGWVPYNERRQIEKKVFDAFRNCITEPKCKDCPWEQCEQFNQKKVEIPFTLALDVLNLLKEQGAVEPKHNPLSPTDWFCGKCGMCISRFHDYCPTCGQAVKWE